MIATREFCRFGPLVRICAMMLKINPAKAKGMFTQFVHPKQGMNPTIIPINASMPHARLNACINSPPCVSSTPARKSRSQRKAGRAECRPDSHGWLRPAGLRKCPESWWSSRRRRIPARISPSTRTPVPCGRHVPGLTRMATQARRESPNSALPRRFETSAGHLQ